MIETCLLNFQVTCVWWYYSILLPIVKEGILVWSESITIVQISTVVQWTISILLLSFQIFRKGEVSLFSSVTMQALGRLFSSSLRLRSQLQVLTPFIWNCYIWSFYNKSMWDFPADFFCCDVQQFSMYSLHLKLEAPRWVSPSQWTC